MPELEDNVTTTDTIKMERPACRETSIPAAVEEPTVIQPILRRPPPAPAGE